MKPGAMFVTETGMWTGPKWVINFPTKTHWRAKSRLEHIELGLVDLIAQVRERGIQSIAVPPLGCGLGGLRWDDVRPLIEAAFAQVPDVRVLLYAPGPPPPASERPVRTERPRMTPARALLIKLMETYNGLAYRLTLLEVQKLAYFLQEAGEPLRLRYVKHIYGPYADNLNKVLERLEGHFTRGYAGERSPEVEIELLPDAVGTAEEHLRDEAESLGRLRRVAELIEGFETPYGMELLASVHWVATNEGAALSDDDIVRSVHAWNARKSEVLQPRHIKVAAARLREQGWMPAAG